MADDCYGRRLQVNKLRRRRRSRMGTGRPRGDSNIFYEFVSTFAKHRHGTELGLVCDCV